jgi:hypothetical protein
MAQVTEETEKQAEEEIEEQEVLDSQSEQAEETEQPETEGETPEADSEKEAADSEGESSEEEESEEEGELVIELEGESPDPESEEAEEKKEAPEWVKRTRKENRELNKKLKQREKEIEEIKAKLEPKPEIPDEPKLWDEGIDGDETKLIEAVRKRDKMLAEAEAEKKAEQEKIEQESANVKKRLDTYEERKEEISKRVPDFKEHVSNAESTFSDVQRQAIAYYFKDKAAELVYVIGKDDDRLETLSKITDPVEMLLAVKDIQSNMKTRTRKPSTKPETTISGQSKVKTTNDQLEAAREKAARTNDYSEVQAIKRELKKKAS